MKTEFKITRDAIKIIDFAKAMQDEMKKHEWKGDITKPSFKDRLSTLRYNVTGVENLIKEIEGSETSEGIIDRTKLELVDIANYAMILHYKLEKEYKCIQSLKN